MLPELESGSERADYGAQGDDAPPAARHFRTRMVSPLAEPFARCPISAAQTMDILTFGRNVSAMSPETAHILSTYPQPDRERLASMVTDPAFFGGSTTAAILWRGRCFGRDTFEVHYYMGRSSQAFTMRSVEYSLDLDLDARDRQRAALAAAHRAAGVTITLGGAQ